MLKSWLKNAVGLFVIALYCLLTASCTKHDYASAIPKDANLVAAMQLDQLASDVRLSESKAISRVKSFSGLIASGQTQEKVNAILEDPSLMGLDFDEPAFLFMTPDKCMGLSIRVDDSDLLDEVVRTLARQQLAGKPVERDDYTWTTLFIGVEMAYDAHTALLMLPTTTDMSSAVLRSRMTQYLKQDSEMQFAETENMKRIETDAKHPVKLYARATSLPTAFYDIIKGLLPAGVKAGNVEVEASLSNDRNKTTLEASVFSTDKQTDKLLKAADKDLRDINGEFTTAAPQDFFLWATIGCKGKKVVELMKKEKNTRDLLFLLERGIDIENMLSSVDGDLTLVLPQAPQKGQWEKQDFMLFGQLAHDDFLKDVNDWKASARDYGVNIGNEAGGKNHFTLKADSYSLHWGVDNKQLYLASDGAYRNRAFNGNSSLIESMKKEVKGCKWFVCINPGAQSVQMGPMGNMAKSVESVTISGTKATQIRICITGTDKEQNVIGQFLSRLIP